MATKAGLKTCVIAATLIVRMPSFQAIFPLRDFTVFSFAFIECIRLAVIISDIILPIILAINFRIAADIIMVTTAVHFEHKRFKN